MAVSQSLTVTEVVNSQSIANNTSKVRIVWTSTQSGESWNGYTRVAKYWVSINGGAEKEYAVSYTLPQNSTKTIVDTTITVEHKDNGTGSVNVRTWMDTSISAGVITLSKDLTLTTIPRASSFTVSTGYTTSDGFPYARLNGTNTLKVSIKRRSSSFTHTVRFYFGSSLVATYTDVGTSKTVTPSFSSWLPHMTTIKRTTELSDTNAPRIMVTTLDSSGNTVGSAASKRFDIYVPDIEEVRPTVEVALAPVSSLGETFENVFVQGYTRVKASFDGSEAKHGASVSSYAMRTGGITYGSPYQSAILSTSGEIPVKCTVTDSRGYYTALTQNITVIPYSKPRVVPHSGQKSVVCKRCTEDGTFSTSGTYLRIMAGRKYSTVTADGEQKNFCRLRYRYREESSDTFSEWAAIIGKTNLDTDEHDAVYEGNLSAKTTYIVEIGVIDDIGREEALTFHIPTDRYDFHMREGGDGAAFGKYAEEKGLLDVAWNTRVRGDLRLGADGLPVADFICADSIVDSWRCRKWNSGAVEAYGSVTVTVYPEEVYGSLYYVPVDVDLPTDIFTAAPYVQIQTWCEYGLFSAHLRTLSKSAMNIFISNSNLDSRGKLEVTLFITAFGKWN